MELTRNSDLVEVGVDEFAYLEKGKKAKKEAKEVEEAKEIKEVEEVEPEVDVKEEVVE